MVMERGSHRVDRALDLFREGFVENRQLGNR